MFLRNVLHKRLNVNTLSSVVHTRVSFRSTLAVEEPELPAEPVVASVKTPVQIFGHKLPKLSFRDTGKGETPSSVRRLEGERFLKEFLAVEENIYGSPEKLNLIATMIRRRKVRDALDLLRYEKQIRSAVAMRLIHGCLQDFIDAHGEEFNDKNTFVAVAQVGKGEYHKVPMIHGRGRTGIRTIKDSRLTLILREIPEGSQFDSKGRLIEPWKLDKLKEKAKRNPNKRYNRYPEDLKPYHKKFRDHVSSGESKRYD